MRTRFRLISGSFRLVRGSSAQRSIAPRAQYSVMVISPFHLFTWVVSLALRLYSLESNERKCLLKLNKLSLWKMFPIGLMSLLDQVNLVQKRTCVSKILHTNFWVFLKKSIQSEQDTWLSSQPKIIDAVCRQAIRKDDHDVIKVTHYPLRVMRA